MHFLFTLQAIKSHWVTCSDPRLLSGLPSASTRVNPKLLSTLQKFLYKIVHFNHKKPWLFSKHFINKPNTSFFRQKNLNCKKCKNNNNLGRFWEENVPEKKNKPKTTKVYVFNQLLGQSLKLSNSKGQTPDTRKSPWIQNSCVGPSELILELGF